MTIQEEPKRSILIENLTEEEYQLFVKNKGNRGNKKFLLDLLSHYDKQIEFLLKLEKLKALTDFYFDDDKTTASQIKSMLDAIIFIIKKKKEGENPIAEKIVKITKK